MVTISVLRPRMIAPSRLVQAPDEHAQAVAPSSAFFVVLGTIIATAVQSNRRRIETQHDRIMKETPAEARVSLMDRLA